MSDDGSILEYEHPQQRPRWHFTIGPPIVWGVAAALVGVWTLPFWIGLCTADVDAFYMRPVIDGIVAVGIGGPIVLAICIRSAIWSSRASQRPEYRERTAWLHLITIVSASLSLLYLDSTGFGLRLRFERHRAEFESARIAALARLLPGEQASHAPIGPFRIVAVERGLNGIAFRLTTGSGFEHGGEMILVPPGDGGSLGGGWRWEATD